MVEEALHLKKTALHLLGPAWRPCRSGCGRGRLLPAGPGSCQRSDEGSNDCEHFGWGLQGLMHCHGLEQQVIHVMLLVPLYEGSPSRLSHEPSGRRHEYRGTVPVKSLAHSLGIQGPPCGLGGPWMPRMSCLGRLLSGSLRQEGIV